jgi:hypothetical protein
MPWVGFEPTIAASERAKTVHALDRSAIVTGTAAIELLNFKLLINYTDILKITLLFLSIFISNGRNPLLKNAWYASNINVKRLLQKIKISPTCIRGRPQNMLEWSPGLADRTEQHTQEIQGIRPHVSGRPSDQSDQLGHLSHLDFHYHSRSKNITTPSSVD